MSRMTPVPLHTPTIMGDAHRAVPPDDRDLAPIPAVQQPRPADVQPLVRRSPKPLPRNLPKQEQHQKQQAPIKRSSAQ